MGERPSFSVKGDRTSYDIRPERVSFDPVFDSAEKDESLDLLRDLDTEIPEIPKRIGSSTPGRRPPLGIVRKLAT